MTSLQSILPTLETGIPPTTLLISLLITGLGFVLAWMANRLMRTLSRLSKKSRFKLDTLITRIAARPIAILIGTLFFVYALRLLPPVRQTFEQWPGIDRAVVILIGAWMLGSLVRELIEVYGRPFVESTETDFDERLLQLLDLTAGYIIYILGIAAALHTLGIKITGLLASLGIAGLAVALATKTILSNFFGGLILTTDRYIQPGHRVKIGEWIGDVEEITLYKTTIRTRDNLLVSIPNDVLMNETTVNYFLPEALTRVSVDVGVSYDADLDHVTDVIKDIIESCDQVSERKEPEVNVRELGGSSINLRVLVWQDDPKGQRKTRDHIYREIIRRFREENIEIPFPQRDVTAEGSLTVTATDDSG